MLVMRTIWFNMLGTTLGVRSNTDSGNEKADTVDDDGVELEKSNILLMGPTGSGNLSLTIFWLFNVLEHCIFYVAKNDL